MGNYRKYRQAPRKDLVKLTISSLSSQESLQKLAKAGQIIEASASGILIKIKRSDFVSKELKSNLNIDQLLGKSVYFKIHEMNLEIGGVVARTKFLGKDGFMIAIDYTVDAPEYWRECLMDLLPTG
ncbi:MAG: hypothetical protein K0R29_2070 [Pseudobdellovibrio sp.]|jgi:hypothetical protein|nr:hypothetical protein [Pseudobdellovibrio sp.]